MGKKEAENSYNSNKLTPWELEQVKRQKRQQQAQKQQKRMRFDFNLPKLKKSRQKRLKLHMTILLLFFGSLTLAMLLFVLPFSRVNQIQVNNADQYLKQEVIKASHLSYYESLFFLYPKTSQLEQNITDRVGDVKKTIVSYEPGKVIITVKTYPLIAYVLKNNKYYKLTTSGVAAKVAEDKVSGNYPIFYGGNATQLKKMTQQLNKVSAKIRNAISEIHFTPTKTDPGQVHLYMNDGNEVIAKTATFADKMQYYPGIAASMDQKGVVDLEVGAYSYPYSQIK